MMGAALDEKLCLNCVR